MYTVSENGSENYQSQSRSVDEANFQLEPWIDFWRYDMPGKTKTSSAKTAMVGWDPNVFSILRNVNYLDESSFWQRPLEQVGWCILQRRVETIFQRYSMRDALESKSAIAQMSISRTGAYVALVPLRVHTCYLIHRSIQIHFEVVRRKLAVALTGALGAQPFCI